MDVRWLWTKARRTRGQAVNVEVFVDTFAVAVGRRLTVWEGKKMRAEKIVSGGLAEGMETRLEKMNKVGFHAPKNLLNGRGGDHSLQS